MSDSFERHQKYIEDALGRLDHHGSALLERVTEMREQLTRISVELSTLKISQDKAEKTITDTREDLIRAKIEISDLKKTVEDHEKRIKPVERLSAQVIALGALAGMIVSGIISFFARNFSNGGH